MIKKEKDSDDKSDPLFYKPFIENGLKYLEAKEVIKILEKKHHNSKRKVRGIEKISLERNGGIEKIEVIIQTQNGKQETVNILPGDIVWVECWEDESSHFYLESTGGRFWNIGKDNFTIPEKWGHKKIFCGALLKKGEVFETELSDCRCKI